MSSIPVLTTKVKNVAHPPQQVPSDLLRWYRQQFVNRPSTYCTYDPWSYTGIRQQSPCTDAILSAHLFGKQPIALDAQTHTRRAKWLSIESDAPDGLEQLQALRAHFPLFGIVGLLEAYTEMPCLWILLAEPLAAPPLWYFLDSLVNWVAARPGVEVDPGDLIVLPDLRKFYPRVADTVCPPGTLDVYRDTFAPFVDAEGQPCHGPSVVEMLTWLQMQPRMTCEDMVTALHVMHGYEQDCDEEYAEVIADLQHSSLTYLRMWGLQ